MASVPVNIGTTATLIATISPTAPQTTWIHVDTTSPPVFIGPNSNVSTTNGLQCGPGSNLSLYANYAVGTSAAVTVYGICGGTVAGTVKVSATTS